MQFFNKIKQVLPPAVTMNLSGALSSFQERSAEPRGASTEEEWTDIWRRMLPYTKTAAKECAQTYVNYVAQTGCTTCPEEDVAYRMRQLLWEAFRRADIKRWYPGVDQLPSLAPYFVDMVRLLNSKESADNHVAYICVKNTMTQDTAWYVAPISEGKRSPNIGKGENEIIFSTLY